MPSPVVTPAATLAPALPCNPNNKRPIGISLSPATDRVLVQWVDYLGKVRTAEMGRRPTRGTVLDEIVEQLLAAGWTPGDKVKVVRPEPPKPTRR